MIRWLPQTLLIALNLAIGGAIVYYRYFDAPPVANWSGVFRIAAVALIGLNWIVFTKRQSTGTFRFAYFATLAGFPTVYWMHLRVQKEVSSQLPILIGVAAAALLLAILTVGRVRPLDADEPSESVDPTKPALNAE